MTPSVWRHATSRSQVLAAFGLGTTLGALASATALWLLSGLTTPIPAGLRYAVLGAALLGLGLRARGLIDFPVPQNARQIPQDVFRRRPARAALRFGVELGTGVRTYLPSSLPYVPALIILLLHPPYVGAVAIGLGFGLARGAVPVRYERRRRRTAAPPQDDGA